MTAEVQHPPVKVETGTVINNPQQENRADSPPTIVTVRMVVDGKEVGSIIGKKGDNVKRYRESSGAKINISDASCPERIVTITGLLEQIRIAFNLMCIKFEDDLRASNSPGSTLPPVHVRLVIPASQCGSLIGKGGTKIKELREITGACVQVASDMLPGSTERVVTITGSATSISNCVTEVCSIMLESPPKGATIPYRPKPQQQTPMMYGMTAAYGMPGPAGAIPGQPGMPGQPPVMPGQASMAMPPPMAAMTTPVSSHPSSEAAKLASMQQSPILSQAAMTFPHNAGGAQQALMSPMAQQGAPLIMNPPLGATGINPYAAVMQQGLGLSAMNSMNAAYVGGGARPFNNNLYDAMSAQQQNQSAEMVIPNELIGCIIGRGGAKINEIRNLSGAQIKISNCEEGTNDRKVTITGYPNAMALATYLINTSIEIHKAQLLMASQEQATTTSNPNPATAAAGAQPSVAAAAAVAASVASNLTQPSVSSQSNSQQQAQYAGQQPQLTSQLMTAVQLQHLQKQATQSAVAQQPQAHAAVAASPFSYGYALPGGLAYATPQFAGAAAYDPKTMLASANKLKMLPTPTGLKLDQRYAPY